LVGFVDRTTVNGDTALHNAVALIQGGQVTQTFHKRLLPTYDVFDDSRYFTPGVLPLTFALEDTCFGVTICEDIWNDVDSSFRRAYASNPVAACVEEGAQVLINIAASPFTLAKRHGRATMLAEFARKNARPLVFVNQVGGNDDILFDGASAAFGPTGNTLQQAHAFRDDMRIVDLDDAAVCTDVHGGSDESAALDALVMGTRDYAHKTGFKTAVLGLSGGIDSALVACIAAEALGNNNVLGIAMPTRYSSQGSKDDAEALARSLGIQYQLISIDRVFQTYLDELTEPLAALAAPSERDTTLENIQARIRCATLMAVSNRTGRLLLTTGNKSEIAVGYCTLYGDMAGGLAEISDLPKTFVYEVCAEVNRRADREIIPQTVIDKAPSAELRPDQRDDDSLPPYDVLDPLLEQIVEDGRSVDEIVAAGGDRQTTERVMRLVRGSEYKRKQMPPGLIVTSKAFGPGRRYPIAAK
jgi:NAD+ synthetase